MKRLPRLALDWAENETAVGPDGTRYSLQSEWCHPGRVYWPMVKRPEAEHREHVLSMTHDEGGVRSWCDGTSLGLRRGPAAGWPYPPDFPDEVEVFANRHRTQSKAQAIRWCEVDAARRAAR